MTVTTVEEIYLEPPLTFSDRFSTSQISPSSLRLSSLLQTTLCQTLINLIVWLIHARPSRTHLPNLQHSI